MTARIAPARREAFLAALRATGNQTIAAERAKVSRAWVQLQRKHDPAFRRAVADAVEQAKAVLRGPPGAETGEGHGTLPPGGRRYVNGQELVVRGAGGSGGGKRVQVARARLRQWTPRIEDRFLAALATTCNVTAACAEAGLTTASAYAHRKRWRSFAERWDAAVETAWIGLEAALLEAGANLFSNAELSETAPIRGMRVEHAIHLLHMHKHRVHGIGKAPGRAGRARAIEDLRASILRKIEAIERAEGRRSACSAGNVPGGRGWPDARRPG